MGSSTSKSSAAKTSRWSKTNASTKQIARDNFLLPSLDLVAGVACNDLDLSPFCGDGSAFDDEAMSPNLAQARSGFAKCQQPTTEETIRPPAAAPRCKLASSFALDAAPADWPPSACKESEARRDTCILAPSGLSTPSFGGVSGNVTVSDMQILHRAKASALASALATSCQGTAKPVSLESLKACLGSDSSLTFSSPWQQGLNLPTDFAHGCFADDTTASLASCSAAALGFEHKTAARQVAAVPPSYQRQTECRSPVADQTLAFFGQPSLQHGSLASSCDVETLAFDNESLLTLNDGADQHLIASRNHSTRRDVAEISREATTASITKLQPDVSSLKLQEQVAKLLRERERHCEIEDLVALPGQLEEQEHQSKAGVGSSDVESADWLKYLESRKPVPLDALPLLTPDCKSDPAPNGQIPRSSAKLPMRAAAEAALAFPWRSGTQSLLYGCQRVQTLAPGQAGADSRLLHALEEPLAAGFSRVPSSKALRACELAELPTPLLKTMLGRPASLPSLPSRRCLPIVEEYPLVSSLDMQRKSHSHSTWQKLSSAEKLATYSKTVERKRRAEQRLNSLNFNKPRLDVAGLPLNTRRHRMGGA